MPMIPTKEKTAKSVRGVYYLMAFYSVLGVLAMGAFFTEGFAFFSDHPTTLMNDAEFFVAFVVTLIAIVCFMVFAHRNFHIRFRWPFAFLFITLFVCNTIGVFNVQLTMGDYEGTVASVAPYIFLSAVPQLRFILSFGISCLYLYLFYAVIPLMFHNIRRLHFICYAVVIAMIAAIVYSLIAEWDLYRCIVDETLPWTMRDLQSFTNNPNTFSFYLILGCIAIMILHNRRSHWWWLTLLVATAIYALLQLSGTGVICTSFITFTFFVYRFARTVRKNPFRASVVFVFFLLFVVASGIILGFSLGPAGTFIARFSEALKSDVFSGETLHGRTPLWESIYHQLNTPMKWVFGFGDIQVYYLFGAEIYPGYPAATFYAHNGFIHQVYAGGFIRFAAYLVLLIRFFLLAIDAMKGGRRVGCPCLIGMIAIMLRGLLETNSILGFDTNIVVIYLLLILPVEVNRSLNKHPEVIEYENVLLKQDFTVKYRYEYSPTRLAQLAFLFLTPAVGLAIGVVPLFFHMGLFARYSTWTYYVLWFETFLFLPLTWYFCGHLKGGGRYAGCLLFGAAYVLFVGLGVFLGPSHNMWAYGCIGVLALCPLVMLLFTWNSVVSYPGKTFLNAYVPHTIMLGVLVAVGSLGYAVNEAQSSIFCPIMMAIGVVVAYIAMTYMPFADRLTYPLREKALHFDLRHTAIGIRKERKQDAKQEKYMKGAKREHKPGNVYYVRL